MSQFVLKNERQAALAITAVQKLEVRAKKPWVVTIEPHFEKRTTQANARLWALHALMANHVGVTPAEMHEEALCRYFGYREVQIGPFIRRVPLQRSRMQDKATFQAFLFATEAWYLEEFGVYLPEREGA